MSTRLRNIGIPGVNPPEKTCEDDVNCPFHGKIKLRGRIIKGNVISTKMHDTVVIQRDYDFYVPKYERYERRHSRLSAHCPACIEVRVGDEVQVCETRRISKTVAFVVVERTKKGDE